MKQTTVTVNWFGLSILVIALGLGWWYIGRPIVDMYNDFQRIWHPTEEAQAQATPSPTPIPVSTGIDIGSKVVVLAGQWVFESREGLNKVRGLYAWKPAEYEQTIRRMVKDGECLQLTESMRATVIDIQGDDVQIRQGEPGPYAAKWWIEKKAAQ